MLKDTEQQEHKSKGVKLGNGMVARQKREYFFASLTQSGTQVEVKKYDINVNCMVRQGQLRATTVCHPTCVNA